MWFLLLSTACTGGHDATEGKPAEPAADISRQTAGGAEPGKPKHDFKKPASDAGSTPEEKAALEKAETAMFAVRDDVKAKLGAALKGDPVAAIPTCGDAAKAAVTREAAGGVKVGRSSTRLRNPENAPPDWVATWLGAQPAEAKSFEVEGFARIDSTPAGPVARVLKPLGVEAACVTCHGPREELKPEISQALAAKYPADAALGYHMGDLRGALWAETPVQAATP
jgi:hypothetical protein